MWTMVLSRLASAGVVNPKPVVNWWRHVFCGAFFLLISDESFFNEVIFSTVSYNSMH